MQPRNARPNAPKRKAIAKTAWKRYSRALKAFLALRARSEGKAGASRRNQANPLREFAEILETRPSLRASFPAALILHSFRDLCGRDTASFPARDLVALWSIDQKLCELAADYGVEARNFAHDLAIFSDALALATGKAPSTKKLVPAMIARTFSDGKLSSLLGIHEWDGVRWFNKEAAETILESGLLIAIIRDAGPIKAQALSRARRLAFSALKKSEYRVEGICAAFPVTREKTGTDGQ